MIIISSVRTWRDTINESFRAAKLGERAALVRNKVWINERHINEQKCRLLLYANRSIIQILVARPYFYESQTLSSLYTELK